MKLKEYTSIVKLEFSFNNFDAYSIKEYKQKVKNSFKQEFNIDLKVPLVLLYQICPVLLGLDKSVLTDLIALPCISLYVLIIF